MGIYETDKNFIMKKKIIYAMAIIVCISFFSFKKVGQCTAETCLGKCLPEKIIPVTTDVESNLSPLYNLLKI